MDKTAEQEHNSKDIELAALSGSCAIIAGFVIYWAVQIQSVREMLELAYG